jgi:hypothetical protein
MGKSVGPNTIRFQVRSQLDLSVTVGNYVTPNASLPSSKQDAVATETEGWGRADSPAWD